MSLILKNVLNDKEVLKLIVDLNKEQLSEGLDSDGLLVGTYRARTEHIARNYQFYGVDKPRKDKIEGQPYNFEWSGRFIDSIFALEKDLSIVIDADVIRTKDGETVNLLDKFGEKILGLTKENFEKVNTLVIGKAIEYITSNIFA